MTAPRSALSIGAFAAWKSSGGSPVKRRGMVHLRRDYRESVCIRNRVSRLHVRRREHCCA
jgi:hypothetical protein